MLHSVVKDLPILRAMSKSNVSHNQSARASKLHQPIKKHVASLKGQYTEMKMFVRLRIRPHSFIRFA